MREVLELCIRLDRLACETYRTLADSQPDPELADTFRVLADEEFVHVGWWTKLLGAWDRGLVPDIADEHGLRDRLAQIHDEISAIDPSRCEELSSDEALELAARLEFYLLDPLFGDLIELVRPGSSGDTRQSYAQHVLRLVDLIERRHSRRELATFLGGALRRAFDEEQRLRAATVRDPLTGLENRRGLLADLDKWLSWSKRYGRPLGVVLVDLDHFRRINDDFGNSAADYALEVVGQALAGSVRASDSVGRFGGDGFMVLAPEADDEGLQALIARVLEAVTSHPVTIGDELLALTASAGGAWAPGGADVHADQLIAQADRSLFEAKHTGRNRCGTVLASGRM